MHFFPCGRIKCARTEKTFIRRYVYGNCKSHFLYPRPSGRGQLGAVRHLGLQPRGLDISGRPRRRLGNRLYSHRRCGALADNFAHHNGQRIASLFAQSRRTRPRLIAPFVVGRIVRARFCQIFLTKPRIIFVLCY